MFTRTPSPHPRTAIALAVLLAVTATAAVAADPDPTPEPASESGVTALEEADRSALGIPAGAAPSLGERISAMIAARDAKIAALQVDFDNAATEEEALAVQRAIERAALVTETAVLHAQLELARERDDAESVTRLEASLAVLDPDGKIAAEIAAADAEVVR